jgi:hypothetical protein
MPCCQKKKPNVEWKNRTWGSLVGKERWKERQGGKREERRIKFYRPQVHNSVIIGILKNIYHINTHLGRNIKRLQ